MVNKKAEIVNALYCKAKRYRAAYKDPQWKQAAEYLWGDQNIRRTTSGNQNDFVINIVYKDYQLTQSMLSRDIPSVELSPITDEIMDIKDPLTKAINHVYVSNDFIIRQIEMLASGLPFGTGFFKVTWDGEMRMGLGDIRLEAVDTRNVFFMPGTGRMRKALIVFERKIVDKLTALHLYPKHADAIKSLFSLNEDTSSQPSYSDSSDIQYGVTETGPTYSYLNSSYASEPERANIEIVEAWFIDPTTIGQVPKLFDQIKKTGAYKALKSDEQDTLGSQAIFPRGRLQVFSGDHLFDDRPNPFPSFPYAQYVNQEIPAVRPGDELGMGEFDQLFEIQDMTNTRFNQNIDTMDHTAQGGFGITDGTFDTDEMTSDPKRVYNTARVGNFQWVNPPSVPPEAFKMISDTLTMGREIQNRADIMNAKPAEVRSGDAIEQLNQIANRVVVTRTHSLESCIRALTRQIISMIGLFYQRGVHYPEGIDLTGINPDAFEVIVKAGLNLPASKTQAQVWLRQLRELEAIDNEVLLENTDSTILPNKEAVIARMRQKWQEQQAFANQQAQAEMAAAQAKTIQMPQRQVA